MGYHKAIIPKGIVGEFSKITEEYHECLDALEQDQKIMLLVELSDLIGAIDLFLNNHYASITLQDLINMSKLTQKVFKDGTRT